MKRLGLLLVIAILVSVTRPATVSAADGNGGVSPGGGGLLVDWSQELGPSTEVGTPENVSDGPIVDLGDDIRDAFCGGTNYSAGCDPEPVEETPVAPVLTPGMVTQAFQRVPLPATPLVIEPVDGVTLVNLPTNFHTPAGPLSRTVTLLGRRIDLAITPVRWTWSFGDGSTVTTDTPGAPYPDLEVAHTYERAQQVRPTVATTYTATYRVDGGPAQPVPGSVTVTSPPAALEITTATTRLADTAR